MTSEASVRGLRCAEAMYPAGMRLGAHVHDQASITLLAGGSLDELDARGRPTRCERGRLILRPAGQPHGNHIGRDGVVNLELDLEPELLEAHDVRIRDAAIITRAPLASLATRLRRALHARDTTRSLAIEGLALEIIALALTDRRPRASRAIAHAYERIRSEFRAPLSIATLAHEADMHPVAFARAFRAAYLVSPAELVRALRIDWAADQLRGRSASIAAIAADAGFYDQSHFARAFAARIGCSPSEYRDALREKRKP